MTIRDPKTGTVITWIEVSPSIKSYGHPLIRRWKGPSTIPSDEGRIIESESEDSIKGRDDEIHVLLIDMGWVLD